VSGDAPGRFAGSESGSSRTGADPPGIAANRASPLLSSSQRRFGPRAASTALADLLTQISQRSTDAPNLIDQVVNPDGSVHAGAATDAWNRLGGSQVSTVKPDFTVCKNTVVSHKTAAAILSHFTKKSANPAARCADSGAGAARPLLFPCRLPPGDFSRSAAA
jgi:hypothetical protein